METTLDRGTVIKVPERQRNLYKIMSVDFSKRKYNVQGCSNAPGFPIKEGRGAGYYAVKFDHAGMEVFAKGTVEESDRPTMLPKTEQKVKRRRPEEFLLRPRLHQADLRNAGKRTLPREPVL